MFRVKRAGINPWKSQVFGNSTIRRPVAPNKTGLSTFARTSNKTNGGHSVNRTGKRCASANPASKPGKTGSPSAWKILGGVGALCGGGLAGGAFLYAYNEDFRNFANKSLPLIETFNLALGPVVSSDESTAGSKPASSAGQDKLPPGGPLNLGTTGSGTQPSTKPRTQRDQQPVASVSSVDQSAVSVVDLDIASSVEEGAKQVKKPQVTAAPEKGDGSKPSAGEATAVSSVASISALDQIPVTSLDLDIAGKAEEDASVVTKLEAPKDADAKTSKETAGPATDKPVDTSFTEQELTTLVNQTAVEVNIEQALSNLKQLGDEAIEAQKKAAEAIREHVSNLRTMVESEEMASLEDASESVTKAQNMAQDEAIAARSSAVKVNEEIEKLHVLLKQAETAGASEASATAAAEAARVSYDLQTAAAEVQKAKAELMILGEQEKALQDTREVFIKELKAVMPELLRGQSEGTEKGGDGSSEAVLLAYARRRVEQLKRQLRDQRDQAQQQLARSLSLQEEQDAKLMEQKIGQEVQRMSAEFNAALTRKESELAAQHEASLRQQLRRQAAAYSDNLAEVLRIQAAELDHKFNEELKEKLRVERERFDAQLKGAWSRLRGVEFAVESRAETEKQGRQARNMWLACHSLTAALSKAVHGRPSPLQPHLAAVHDASPNDAVVTRVLYSVPEVAASRGVYSEEDLRSRFYAVRRACRRVAMVTEGHNGPWAYFLSYVQSLLVFDSFDPVKDGEMVDLDNVDTYQLLARAEYYLREGDLELAARFLNQLGGEARRLSRDWLREARLLLETRQAANFLTAYAAASGMAGTN